MNTKQRTVMILVLLLSLAISSCAPGQLFGPTVTPTQTSTLTPTSTPVPTPTSTPVSVEAVLLANGFTRGNPNQTCTEGPCKIYYNADLLMIATHYDTGRFILERVLATADANMKQGPIFLAIMHALYPTDVADAIIGGKVPRSGEIGGYKYDIYMGHEKALGDVDVAVFSITPTP